MVREGFLDFQEDIVKLINFLNEEINIEDLIEISTVEKEKEEEEDEVCLDVKDMIMKMLGELFAHAERLPVCHGH